MRIIDVVQGTPEWEMARLGIPTASQADRILGEGWMQTRSGLYVPATAAPPRRPTCVDLFCGAGGFSLGMHQAGFHVVAAADADLWAAVTYLCNLGAPHTAVYILPPVPDGQAKRDVQWLEAHEGERMTAAELFEAVPRRATGAMESPGSGWIASSLDHQRGSCAHHIEEEEDRGSFDASPVHREPCLAFFLGDVRSLTGAMVLEALGMGRGELDCVVGGPPCQGFSKLNVKRGPRDPRNMLVFEFARLVLELWPRTMVMENVPEILNMLTPEGVPVIDALCRILEEGGFGTYNALRRALLGTSGAGAAVRGQPRETRQERRRRERAAAKAAAQPDLFAGATA